MRVALYSRVSTHDQHTLSMQISEMRKYVEHRDWEIVTEIQEIGSGTKERKQREDLLNSARKRQIDTIIVWKLDRWGRSLSDLILTLKELRDLGVGFISLTEALDFTTAAGRAMAGLLAVFAQFEKDMLGERVKAGIAHARKQGKPHGRPKSAIKKAEEVVRLYKQGMNKSQIARQLGIGRTSVRRILQKFYNE